MYGDCQILSNMGANVVSSETLFSSAMGNPNFDFLPNMPFHSFPSIIPKEESGMMREKEEMESGSGSEQVEEKSGNEQESTEKPLKKKRYHRHTARQIQDMEALFKECPHPDDKQRMKLSQELGLKPRQVKFWFQNRLRACLLHCFTLCWPANSSNAACFYICSPSLDLDMNIYSRQFPDSLGSCTEMMPMLMLPGTSSFAEAGLVLMEEEKTLAMELAMSSIDELVKMCQATEPLWIRNNENGKELLNLEEHAKMFPWPLNLKQHSNESRNEATRDSAVVIMNSITLVDAFLDANKWMELFPSIVARAKTVQIITSGVPGASGSLHLMYAELQVLSPLVPTREAYFLRYCQQNVEEGNWAIVDFPIDGFHDNIQPCFPLYRRRPSGCVIQDMPNGYSRVTWVEQAEIEEKPVHQIFSQFVSSGMAFGAHRWLGVLQRQCERVASLMARNISDLGVIPSPEARKNLMRLAQRMIRTFSVNVSTCGGQSWTALSDSCNDTVRITTRKITEPGQPNGVILSAVSTTWLPFPHYHLDVLSNGNALHEVAHIANGSHPGNCISLLRINVASNSSQNVELMLQESCTDQSGSLVVYTTVNVDSIQLAMSGEDPSCIPLLPLGFVIVPVESTCNSNTVNEGNSIQSLQEGNCTNSGCLLTVGLQVLASTIPSAKLNLSSVNAINNHLRNTVHQITSALSTSAASCPEHNAAPQGRT
ncbi:hypothetical protein P3X46_032323 [Hevea brasiliensis]|uniref:Homeobox domain-containing protein n=1 Tax=Hevea brasiliensis TaxID=3981 RepID=A0ABQ9KE37_HEVBR|nr:hypothetical protein P3X46_032323 [Hevea brasiliensis]